MSTQGEGSRDSCTPGRLVRAIEAPTGPSVLELLEPLRAALGGFGPALLAHPAGHQPAPELLPDTSLDPGEDSPDDPTALVVATSGSTGTPRGVLLPASALLASAAATHDRLGGAGTWLLALPVQHIAGWAVLVRSLVARREPRVVDLATGFTAEKFTEGAQALGSGRRYTALVPTQLARLLDDPAATAALASFDAVLIGGARLQTPLRERAVGSGIKVVATYGMSETCGGCVYDGVPLDGVEVDVTAGVLRIAGPVVARGYRGAWGSDRFDLSPGGARRFTTGDLGALESRPGITHVQVFGRADDVIVTGGEKVAPSAIEAILIALPEVREVLVVGVPDDTWGQLVVAVIVPAASSPVGSPTLSLDAVRDRIREDLGRAFAPQAVVLVEELPLIGPGKPDRPGVLALAAAAVASIPR